MADNENKHHLLQLTNVYAMFSLKTIRHAETLKFLSSESTGDRMSYGICNFNT